MVCTQCFKRQLRQCVRLAQVGYIKLFIICILLILIFHLYLYFNSQCLASLETNFSLVALSEIYPTCAKQNVFREVIDNLWLPN